MEISDLTIRLFVLIFPGIITAIIVDNLTVHTRWSNFAFGLYSIILGFSSYLVYQLLLFIIAVIKLPFVKEFSPHYISFWRSLFNKSIEIPVLEVIFATSCGLILGLVVTAVIQNKILFWFAKKLQVSQKFGDEDLFMYFLNAKEIDWVWVRDEKNGYTYEGRVDAFSENNMIRELTLTNVKVYPYDSRNPLYDVSNIYLSFPIQETMIIEVSQNKNKESITHEEIQGHNKTERN